MRIKHILVTLLLFTASAVFLTVIQPPFSLAFFAWVAYVPFILACTIDAKTRQLYIASYLIGLIYWLGNLYWIIPVTWAGWLAFCLYIALLWPVLVITIRFCISKNIPISLSVAVCIVGVESLQGLFLGGFFWRFLAHSQYENIALIQIADIFGASGVSFLVAMVNGLIAGLIIAVNKRKLFKARYIFETTIVAIAIVATILYGRWRIEQSPKFVESGPLVAAVQSNVPQSVKHSHQAEEKIFYDLLVNSQSAAAANSELIIWPETMVQAILDKGLLKLKPTGLHTIFDEKLKNHAKDTAYLLVGASGGVPEVREDWSIDLTSRYNTVFMYTPTGQQADQQYSKIHLVPFGEFVPFKKSAPWLHDMLLLLTPYNYDYTLDPGTDYTIFEMTSTKTVEPRDYQFSVMICYEDTVPKIARRFTIGDEKQKRIDWLVNISNDGWFVRFEKDKISHSTELAQHAAICSFRAIENRVPVVRSVNTGISCIIDSLGHIQNGFAAGNLPKNAMDRQAVQGWFADYVPVDKRVTFFSKYGQWLDLFCVGFVIAVIIVLITQPFFRNNKNSTIAQKNSDNHDITC